jgi:DNA uptake protein ComE-like DNA-binding protein
VLPGITDAEAAKIVQGRPYKEPGDLVAKKILPESAFSKIKDRVTAGHSKS